MSVARPSARALPLAMPPGAELNDAIVLRLQPVRDADLIVTFLDPSRGRVDAYARAARKSVRRFGGRLELFMRGRAALKLGRGDLPQLVGFEREVHLVPATMDWPLLCLLSSVAELGAIASQPEHADPQLHAWTCAALTACVGLPASRIRLACLAIDLGFLRAVGCLPSQERCGDCFGGLASGAVWREASEGWLCTDCQRRDLAARASDRDPEAALNEVNDDVQNFVKALTLSTIRELIADPAQAHTAFLSRRVGRLLRARADALLAEVLPRPLRTREPLNEAMDAIPTAHLLR